MNLGIGLGLAFGRFGASAGPSIPTYAQYQAAIATLANKGSVDWVAPFLLAGDASDQGSYTTTAAAYSGVMYGSPNLANISGVYSSPARVVQHAAPDLTAANAISASGRDVLIRVTYLGTDDVLAKARSGYTSLFAPAVPVFSVRFFAYYDAILGPLQCDPGNSAGPIPWDMLSTTY